MEEKIRNKFTNQVIDLAAKNYGIVPGNLVEVGQHQSLVYKVQNSDQTFFVRITNTEHRSINSINAEIEWLIYLDGNNFNVAKPIQSIYGKDYEVVKSDGDEFIVVAFTEAVGLGIGEQPWSEETPKELGVLTARMHDLATQYTPMNGFQRHQWFENNFIAKAKDYLPSNQQKVIDELHELVERISKLPIETNSYGLIHGDLVACNYHIDGDTITFFDFDESCYCWYINDIAIQLFYWSLTWQGLIDFEGALLCTKKFFEGYKSVRDLDLYWINKIPLFIRLREIILYISIYRSRNLDDLDLWTKNFMKDRQYRIENRIPFLDIDFSAI